MLKRQCSTLLYISIRYLADNTIKTDRTPEEEDMLDMLINGGKRVSLENLREIDAWYKNVNGTF